MLDRSYFAPVVARSRRSSTATRAAPTTSAPTRCWSTSRPIDFRFVPTDDGVRVVGEPDLPNVTIASRIQLGEGALRCVARATSSTRSRRWACSPRWSSPAPIPRDCGEKTWSLAVFDGDRYAESVLRWVWSEAGGKLCGKVRAGRGARGGEALLTHESEPLAELVRDINKFSNNVMARQLFLALSAEKLGAPGEAKASARVVISEWLRQKRHRRARARWSRTARASRAPTARAPPPSPRC